VLLYDDECGFCRWSVSKVLAWDGARRVRPVALQDDEASELLGGMDPAKRMRSWHLVGIDGSVSSGGDAVAPLLRLLPGGSALAPVVAAFPKTTRRAYVWVAAHRDRLGRIVGVRACSVRPTQSNGSGTRE
jgi:predicted DCC family thiol-disulfide oxidoreductase YuxK